MSPKSPTGTTSGQKTQRTGERIKREALQRNFIRGRKDTIIDLGQGYLEAGNKLYLNTLIELVHELRPNDFDEIHTAIFGDRKES